MPVPDEPYGDYVVDHVVGHGGSALVYRAFHRDEPELAVALKVLDESHRDRAHTDRLAREHEFARRVAHPHVVTMFDRGVNWLAMELVTGGPSSRLTDRSDVLTALTQLAAALDHVHALGIVHCDVKPSNVLLSPTKGAVLVDFGVARSMTDDIGHHRTHIEASLPYLAPEVLRGRAPTPAADEYALACTAVELLTGATPFTGTTTMALVDAQLNSPVPQPSRRFDWMPRAFDSILAKAMAKSPDSRYETCGEFVALISRAIPRDVDSCVT